MTKKEFLMVEDWGKQIYKISCNCILPSYQPEEPLKEVVREMIKYLENTEHHKERFK